MKKLELLILLLFAFSCSKSEIVEKTFHSPQSFQPNYSVTTDELNSFLLKTKASSDYQIELKTIDDSPCYYIVKYDGGWQIISADKRTQKILASGEGDFEQNLSSNPAAQAYFDQLATSIINIDETEGDFSDNLESWKQYCNKADVAQTVQTKSTQAPPAQMYWVKEYITTYEDSREEDLDIPHLMRTKWGQEYPWNIDYPCDPETDVECLTGCTAVAMAQVVYYHREHCQRPSGLWHNLTYDSYVNSVGNLVNFSRSNYVANSSRWAQMPLTSSDPHPEYAGMLMLDLGERIGMHYSSNESGGWPTQSAFAAYGLSYTSTNSFPKVSVVGNVLNAMPVIIVLWSPTGSGHTFIIDGYYREARYMANEYRWRLSYEPSYNDYDETYTQQDLIEMELDNMPYDGMREIVYFTEMDEYLRINWGWDGSFDNGLYSIIPDWTPGSRHYNQSPTTYYGIH